jgi:hypothetical protein
VPISREKAALYPKEWKRISREVRERSGGRCECAGECGRKHAERCYAENGGHGARHRVTDRWRSTVDISGCEQFGEKDEDYPQGSRVVLTVAHLWKGPCAPCAERGEKCGEPSHLKAMCQACHLHYDLPHHMKNAAATRRRKRNNTELEL